MPKKKNQSLTVTPTADIERQAKDRGLTTKEYIEDVLMKDGFGIYIMESERGGSGKAKLRYVDLWKNNSSIDNNNLTEYRRLAENFAPISNAVEWLTDYTVGSIDVRIGDPKSKQQKKYKNEMRKLIYNIRQDRYTKGLDNILSIMVNEALVTGGSGAEIVYNEDIDFMTYATETVLVGENNKNSYVYDTVEPEWKKLGGIRRLKIIDDAVNRLKLHRDEGWEAKYWTLDEQGTQNETLTSLANSLNKKNKDKSLKDTVKFHPWQIFYVTLNRKDWSEKSKSVIAPVVKIAQILEKIQQALGEGLWRAGNKKFFIICGSEKYRWAENTILNVLNKIDEMGGDPNKLAIPVPVGFDIKEMGGQVFTGTEIVDHFVNMIATGMGVPKEVLTGVKGGETEKPWQSSIAMIGRKQKSLQSAIEVQLFEPHLYCVFGKPKEDELGDIIIPKVKFIREDQIGLKEHIDIIYRGLNVANPLSAATKNALERDFCERMGYDDVILPSQEEILEEENYKKQLQQLQQELALLKAKQSLENSSNSEQNVNDGEVDEDKTLSEVGEVEGKVEDKTLSEVGEVEGKVEDKDLKLGDKRQGDPVPPDEEKLKKRLEKGVNVSLKSDDKSKKGLSKNMGSTRNPK